MPSRIDANSTGVSYKKYSSRPPPARRCVLLAKCNELLSQSLCFFSLWPCGRDGFVFEEGGDEVSEEGFAMWGVARQRSVFHVAAGHLGRFLMEYQGKLILAFALGLFGLQ